MKKSVFLNSETLKILVSNNSPGVFGFINFVEKKAWISYSENINEALARNIKLINSKQHKIRSLDGWDVCVFERSENKAEAKKNFRVYCQNYKDKGLEILNKEFKYRVWGEIRSDFRDTSKFLYYIWLGTKIKRQALLAAFENALEGEKYLREFKSGAKTEFPMSSKRLVVLFKSVDLEAKEYKELFNESL